MDAAQSANKPLDSFLARNFGLSKPTIVSLLLTWEKEGRIEIVRNFARSIIKIRILDPHLKKGKVLVALDWQNIWLNIPSGRLSLASGLDKIQKQIAQEVGEIVGVFVFTPLHLTAAEAETFYNGGFYIIHCPKVRTKEGVEKNTTDEILIRFINDMIVHIPDITHICLGSGDKDFCETLRRALRKGLKLMIVAGDINSLSMELFQLADINPFTGRKMVYILSQSQE